MEKETLYTQWLIHRRQIPPPENFADNVMELIENQAVKQDLEIPVALTDIGRGPVRWAAAAGLLLLGIFRIFYIAASLLPTSLHMPY